jgi:hypothetical protein
MHKDITDCLNPDEAVELTEMINSLLENHLSQGEMIIIETKYDDSIGYEFMFTTKNGDKEGLPLFLYDDPVSDEITVYTNSELFHDYESGLGLIKKQEELMLKEVKSTDRLSSVTNQTNEGKYTILLIEAKGDGTVQGIMPTNKTQWSTILGIMHSTEGAEPLAKALLHSVVGVITEDTFMLDNFNKTATMKLHVFMDGDEAFFTWEADDNLNTKTFYAILNMALEDEPSKDLLIELFRNDQ